MPITYDKPQVFALLAAPYREGETVRLEEIQYASAADLVAAGWRPALDVKQQIDLALRQMVDQLWSVLGCAGTVGSWEEALNAVGRMRDQSPATSWRFAVEDGLNVRRHLVEHTPEWAKREICALYARVCSSTQCGSRLEGV